MKINNTVYQALIQEAIRVCTLLGEKVPEDISFKLGSRYRSAGVVKKDKNEIQISQRLAEYATHEEVVNTIIHEIFHILAPNDVHAGRWKQLAKKFNMRTDLVKIYGKIKRLGEILPEEYQKKHAHYKIKCTECNNFSYRLRKSKVISNPSMFRCRRCGASLEIEIV